MVAPDELHQDHQYGDQCQGDDPQCLYPAWHTWWGASALSALIGFWERVGHGALLRQYPDQIYRDMMSLSSRYVFQAAALYSGADAEAVE